MVTLHFQGGSPLSADERQKLLNRLDPCNAIPIYANLSEEDRSDPVIAREVFSCDGLALSFAPKHVRSNPELVRIATINTSLAWAHTPLKKKDLATGSEELAIAS